MRHHTGPILQFECKDFIRKYSERMGNEIGKYGKPRKSVLISRLSLLAMGTESHWRPSETPCRTCLGHESQGIHPSLPTPQG